MSPSYADVVPFRLYRNARSYGSRAVPSEATWAQYRAPEFPRADRLDSRGGAEAGERTKEVHAFAQRTPQWTKGAFKVGNRCKVEKRPMAGRRNQPSAQGLVAWRKQRGPVTGTDAQERLRRSLPCQDINWLARARPFCLCRIADRLGARGRAGSFASATVRFRTPDERRPLWYDPRSLSQVAHPLCNLGQPTLIWP